MYHCHICFYLVGHPSRIVKILKGISPFEQFTHEFLTDDKPDEVSLAKADVILADMQDTDVEERLEALIAGKREEAELILLLDKNQIKLLGNRFSKIRDIWTLPMSDEEIRFHFCGGSKPIRWRRIFGRPANIWNPPLTISPIWFGIKIKTAFMKR